MDKLENIEAGLDAVTPQVHSTQDTLARCWEAVDEIRWNSISGGPLSPLSSMSPTSEHLGSGTEDDPIILNESNDLGDSGECWGTDNPVWDDIKESTEMDAEDVDELPTWWGHNEGMHPQVPDF